MRAIVRTEGLNVHDKPNGKIVDAFKRGDRLKIIDAARHTDTVVWWPVELLDDARKSCGWVDGKALNFEHDNIKMPPPNPPCDFPLPSHDWAGPKPAPLLRTSQVTFWCVFAVFMVFAAGLLTWPWWR